MTDPKVASGNQPCVRLFGADPSLLTYVKNLYGDLVVLNPVIRKLEERGLELSALHNHLLHETPRVMYIHFVGRGDEVELAKGVREALALTKSPLGATASAPETKPEIATEIERIIGYQGTMGGDVFHITVPRNDLHVASMAR